MANPPPPYDDITGISRTVMKDNAQESIGNYNGNARPGEIVVDLTTNPPTPYIGNNIGQLTLLTSAGTYGNIQVGQYLEAGQVGNIIPSGNAVYTLGNATNQWSDLYVSNATIYMNNVPISLTAGNTLTVNGQAILSNDSNSTVSTTGNITAGYFVGNGSLLTGISGGGANLGNLAIDDNNIYNANGQGVVISNFSFIAEAETAYVQIPAGNSASDLSVVQKQGNVRLAANTADWTFDTTGNLTIPNGGYINFVNTGGITQAVNEDLRFTVSDNEEDGWAIQSTVNDGAGTDLTRMQVRYDGIRINTDVSGNNYSWDFRDSGDFDVPKSIRGPVGGNLVISIGDQPSSNTFIDLQTRSYVGDALISNVRIANPNVTVSTSSGAHTWTFDNTGTLNLPGGTGTVESSANNISIYSDAGQLNGMLMYNTGTEIYALQDFAIFTDNANAGHIWRFYANGSMTAPGAINVGNMSIGELPGYITATANTGIILNVSGPDGGFVVDYIKEDGNANTSQGELAFSSETGNTTYRISLTDDAGDGLATKIWRFDGTGNITLPGGGSVYSEGFTPSGNPGNTIVLNPHGSGSITNQKLMVYPTAGDGDHIHMTTGNLYQTELFLGSDDFYVKLANTGNVVINSNDNVGNIATWTFDNTGTLTFPSLANISGGNFNAGTASATVALNAFSPAGNTVSIQAQGNTSSAVISIFSNAGPITNNWTFTTAPLDPTEPLFYVPGGTAIVTPEATGGAGGKNIFIEAGYADQQTYNTSSGGDLYLKGGRGAFNDGGGGGPGGDVWITAGESSDPAGHAGNVYITAGALQSWEFGYNGVLTAPKSVITTPVAYANLVAVAGARAFVNNANLVAAGNFGSQIDGSGANTVPVWSDGANWYIG